MNWIYNVSCTGISTIAEDTKNFLNSTEAVCNGLTPGDRYNVTVKAFFTNNLNEVYSGTASEIQAIGKRVF